MLTTIDVAILKRFADFYKKPIHQTASSGQARVETFEAFVKRGGNSEPHAAHSHQRGRCTTATSRPVLLSGSAAFPERPTYLLQPAHTLPTDPVDRLSAYTIGQLPGDCDRAAYQTFPHTTIHGPTAHVPSGNGPLFATPTLLNSRPDGEAPHPEGLPSNVCLESDVPGHNHG